MPVTPQMLQATKEKDCIAITAERKHYRVDQTFVKRSLRPSEWQTSPFKGTLYIPRQGWGRALNEATAIEYVGTMTNIPVPKLHCSFEDDHAVYLIMEYVDGVGTNELDENQQAIVRQELARHLATLHNLRSNKMAALPVLFEFD